MKDHALRKEVESLRVDLVYAKSRIDTKSGDLYVTEQKLNLLMQHLKLEMVEEDVIGAPFKRRTFIRIAQ